MAPILKEMDTHNFSRDFIAGVTHFAAHHPITDEIRERFLEPGMYRAMTAAIKQEMRCGEPTVSLSQRRRKLRVSYLPSTRGRFEYPEKT